MDDGKRFTVGFTLPALSFQLVREGNRPWGLQGDESIVFYMRPAWSNELTIDSGAVTIVDVASDTVTYDWQAADVDTAGDFRGWFRVTSPRGTEETDEFDIVGFVHAPGTRAELGPVARATRREIPLDWDLLSKLPSFGDAELREKVETAKLSALNAEIATADEANLDRRVIDYIGKKAAIELIPAAISYWQTQIVSQTVRGSEEVATYPNRIAALEKKLEYLIAATKRLEPAIVGIIGVPIGRRPSTPAVDTVGPLITPGLEEFPAPFGGRDPDPRSHVREQVH